MEQDEMTIDLKGLVLSAFRHPVKIVICAILMALALGGFMAMKTYNSYNSEEGLQKLKNDFEEKRIEFVHNREQAERTVTLLKPTIEQKQLYLDRSVLMRMNPYEMYEAEITYLINTNYQIMPDKTYQNRDYTDTVGVSYVNALQSGDLMEAMAAKIDTEACYVPEIMSVSYQSGLLRVKLASDSRQNLNTMMQMVNEEIDSRYKLVKRDVADHTITKTNESTATKTRPDLVTGQKNELAKLQEMQEDVEEAQHELDVLLFEKEPEWLEYSPKLVVKKFIVFGVVGGVVGAILIMGISACGYLFGGKVYSAHELQERLQVVLLGNIPEKLKKDFYSKWLNKAEKRPELAKEVELALAGANIANYAGDLKKVLLTGDVDDKKLDAIQKALADKKSDVVITSSGDMFKNPATMQNIKEYDAVVLVAETGVSTYDAVKKQLTRMKELDKKVLGCVVID